MSIVDCRFIYANRVRNGDIISYTSEHPQFPIENTQDDSLALTWRSRYGTGTGNGYWYVYASNCKIDFDEGGAELTATLTAGAYTAQSLVTEIKTQMDAAGGTYTVSYSESTGKFTIARSAGNFTIRWKTGTNTANCAAAALGFSKAADSTGADTYTSATVVIHMVEYVDVDFGAAYEYNSIAILNHNLTASAVVNIYGADDSAFTSNVVTDALTYNANNIYEFLSTARTKRYCRIEFTDPTNPSMYVQVGPIIIGKYLATNRVFGPFSKGPLDETGMEYSPSSNAFVTQERPALENHEFSFKGLNTTTVDGILLMLAECGVRKAFWLCTDSTAANANSYWVKMKETTLPHFAQYNYWTWDLNVEERL